MLIASIENCCHNQQLSIIAERNQLMMQVEVSGSKQFPVAPSSFLATPESPSSSQHLQGVRPIPSSYSIGDNTQRFSLPTATYYATHRRPQQFPIEQPARTQSNDVIMPQKALDISSSNSNNSGTMNGSTLSVLSLTSRCFFIYRNTVEFRKILMITDHKSSLTTQ